MHKFKIHPKAPTVCLRYDIMNEGFTSEADGYRNA